MDRQCSSCGGFCKKSGCERENVKQEPVAWRFQSPTGGWAYAKYPPIGIEYAAEPLYTQPPQRTWVGLTDEEIDYYIVHRFGVATKKNLVELIRLCEAKSKEKNT